MEQMYMVEIFIDKVAIFMPEGEESAAEKKLITKVKFGPKTQFIIKEGQLAQSEQKGEESMTECDEQNIRKFTRTIRVGKSMLFPSYPDTVLKILAKFPLEIELWTDDVNEVEEFVGVGIMLWDTEFYLMLKETAQASKRVEPLSIKQLMPLMNECGCKQVGEVHFILRLSALGENIITEFQQLMDDPEQFVFRTNRAPSMFQCKRVDENDPNFCMVGSLYETATLEDPTMMDEAEQYVEVCTELQSCSMAATDKVLCKHNNNTDTVHTKKYPIDKIRMGDITGPCGNTNCPLATKVRMYLRDLDIYKKEVGGNVPELTDKNITKNICGKCVCKDDRWHREDCKKGPEKKVPCKGCGGFSKPGHTCEQRQNRTGSKHDLGGHHKANDHDHKPGGKPGSKTVSKTTVVYVFNVTQVPDFKDALGSTYREPDRPINVPFRGCGCGGGTNNIDLSRYYNLNTDDFSSNCVGTLDLPTQSGGCCCAKRKVTIPSQINDIDSYRTKHAKDDDFSNNYTGNLPMQSGGCCCGQPKMRPPLQQNDIYNISTQQDKDIRSRGMNKNNPLVYNAAVGGTSKSNPASADAQKAGASNPQQYVDCKCETPKPKPPCSTLDCECIMNSINKATRKRHKPYCPSYKHKPDCLVTQMAEEQVEEKKKDEDEDEPEILPYGLPPIVLGPCPVMGRPCAYPDGFQRMYKTGALANLPPSYSNAGKVCCTKEFERIKKALTEYMKYEKDNDLRCINTFNVDTERRCCDKEQMLIAMSGKSCCGTHKLDIQEKFKGAKGHK